MKSKPLLRRFSHSVIPCLITIAALSGGTAICGEIHDAALGDLTNKVNELLRTNPDLISAKDEEGSTPLHVAAISGSKNVTALLLADHADLSAKDNRGRTPLHCAALGCHADVAQLLLASNADVTATDNYNDTPLNEAAGNGCTNVADLLLANKADIETKDNEGHTPLYEAASSDYKNMVDLLLAHGADVNAKTTNGETPLFIAADKGYTDVVQSLLAHNADPNAKNDDGEAPLHKTATNTKEFLLKVSTNKAADAKAMDITDSQMTSLDNNHLLITSLLLANNANINIQNNDGETPLHMAAEQGHTDIAILLLSSNADVTVTDNKDHTALEDAGIFNNDGVAEAIRQHAEAPLLEEQRQAKLLQDKKKQAGQLAALKFNQDAADRGDAYGQLRMGERYMEGEGVEKDLAKAKDYLSKAAAQGDSSASNLLVKISSQ